MRRSLVGARRRAGAAAAAFVAVAVALVLAVAFLTSLSPQPPFSPALAHADGVAPTVASKSPAATLAPVAALQAAFPDARLFVPAGAATARYARRLLAGPYPGAAADAGLAAAPFLAVHGAAFGVGPSTSLRLAAVYDLGPARAVHLQQHVGGVPVLGHELVLVVDGDGRVRSVSGHVLDAAGVDTVPSVSAAAAAATALAAAPPGARVAGAPFLAVLAGGGGSAALVWRLRTSAGPADASIFYVDAHGGGVLLAQDALVRAMGRFYDPNPAVNPSVVTDVLPALDAPGDVLRGAHADVFNCATPSAMSCFVERNALPDASGDYLYDPPSPPGGVYDDPFAEVHAYDHVSRYADFWETTLGYPMWPYLTPLEVIVNFSSGMDGADPESYNNAYFNPNSDQIVFGQGGTYDFVYDADVVYHEYTHAIVGDRLASFVIDSLGVDLTGFALNEGTADTFSTLYTGDPFMAEWVGGAAGIRDMENEARCPEDLVGEPHEDGKAWGGANWTARTYLESTLGPGAGAAAMETLLERALLAIDPEGGYPGFSGEVVNQAEIDPTYAAIAADIQTFYEARGLLDCERLVPLDDLLPHFLIVLGRGELLLSVPFVPPPLQFRVDVPPGSGVSLQIGAFGNASLTAWVKRDAPVTFAGFGGALTALDADWTFEDMSSFRVDETSNPPAAAGTYYVAIGNKAQAPLYMGIVASLFDVPLPPGTDAAPADAGASDAGPGLGVEGGGCGCAVAGAAAGAPGSDRGAPRRGARAMVLLAAVAIGAVALLRGRGRGRRRR
jgi:hypothetical protein